MSKILNINMFNKNRLLFVIPFLLFAIIITSFSITKPFNLDEADFINASHGLMNDAKFLSKSPELGLWHPPLYIHLVAAAFKIFKEATIVARGLGFIFFVLTFVFILLICKELFGPEERRIVSLIAGSLYLINPLAIQFSLLIDIDGGLLTLLMTIFCYFFIRFSKSSMGVKEIIFLGFIFGFSMLAKFTTPPLIMPAIFLYYLFRRKYKEAFFYSALIFIVGIASFWIIWHTYCIIFDVQPLYPFKFTFGTKFGQGGLALTQQKILNIMASLKFFFYWVTPPYAILMLIGVFSRVNVFIKSRTVSRLDFLMILGTIIFLFYFYYFPRVAMMKYQTVFYPYFSVIIASFLYNTLVKDSSINKNEIIVVLVFAVAAFMYYLLLFPDMVLWLIYGKNAVSGLLKNHHDILLTLYFAPFLVLPLIFWFSLKDKSFYYSLVVTFFLLAGAAQITQDIKQTADYTTANSWNNYGERGEAETIEYLNKKLPATGYAIMRKDIAYYIKKDGEGFPTREYIYNGMFRKPSKDGLQELRKIVKMYSIEYIQVDTALPLRYCFDLLKADFDLDKQFYNFFIFKKK